MKTLLSKNYNPDVIACLASLSSDEVFTPPKIANQVLDLLPQEIFKDPNTTFLDPASKSGVFLREIAKRLIKGLEKEIPNLQKRLNHIYTKQLFGIAITELTALLSRRSVYCSKTANGKYSVCTKFKNEKGNIYYEKIPHAWNVGACKFCGASKEVYDRDDVLETHAYAFIHKTPQEILKLFGEKNMKFDVIIGNPPYQMSSNDSGIQAIPLYHKFVQQAKKLNPRFLTMIIPARWYSGGMGMNDFRKEMLNDKRIRFLHDFPKSRDCFPGVDIAGGVCYFLWDRDNPGICKVISHQKGEVISEMERPLLENGQEIFIRDNTGLKIVKKILIHKEKMMVKQVESISPFGIPTFFRGKKTPFKNSLTLFSSAGITYIEKKDVKKNINLLDKYKVSIGQLNPDRGGVNNAKDNKMNVITKVKIYGPNQVFTATYLLLNYFSNEKDAKHFMSYMKTRFVRFLIYLTLSSMHITLKNFQFVPLQDFSSNSDIDWSKPIPEIDKQLYKKYGLTKEEIDFIESMVRPME